MNSNDRKTMLKVYELFKSLESIYNKLAELEINGKEYDDEYKELIKLIKWVNKRTNTLLNDIVLCSEDMLDFFKFLQRKENLEPDDIFTITDFDDKNALRRLISYTNSMSISRHEEVYMPLKFYDQDGNELDMESLLSDDMVEDIIEKFAEQGVEITEDMLFSRESVESDVKQEMLVEDDVLAFRDLLFTHTYMDYLLEEIKKETNPEIKAELIKQKYRAIYVCKALEDEFVKSPLYFTKTKLFQKLILSHMKGNEEIYNDAYLAMLKLVVEDDLSSLAEIPEGEYVDLDSEVKLITGMLYDKALLSANYSRKIDHELYEFNKICEAEAKNSDIKKRLAKLYDLKMDYSIEKY